MFRTPLALWCSSWAQQLLPGAVADAGSCRSLLQETAAAIFSMQKIASGADAARLLGNLASVLALHLPSSSVPIGPSDRADWSGNPMSHAGRCRARRSSCHPVRPQQGPGWSPLHSPPPPPWEGRRREGNHQGLCPVRSGRDARPDLCPLLPTSAPCLLHLPLVPSAPPTHTQRASSVKVRAQC